MNFQPQWDRAKRPVLIRRDIASLSPFPQIREYALVVDHAQGSELWDVDGRHYIDFMAGVAVLNVGHRHPTCRPPSRNKSAILAHLPVRLFPRPSPWPKSSRPRPKTKPGLLRQLRQGRRGPQSSWRCTTGQYRFIGFTGAFTAAPSAPVLHRQQAVQRAQLPVRRPGPPSYPNPYRPAARSAATATTTRYGRRLSEEEIFRTMLAPTGVAGDPGRADPDEAATSSPRPASSPSPRIVRPIRHPARWTIQSGAGRTGKWWAVEHENVEPDIICFAKGIGRQPAHRRHHRPRQSDDLGRGSHGSTFGGNPVAATAALANPGSHRTGRRYGPGRRHPPANTLWDALAEMEARHPSLAKSAAAA